jgi:4-amino-4-deoxy-L-arabinose transferase-like glycosyltransferase
MKSAWVSKYWAELILLGIIFLAGFLNLWNLWNLGFSTPYYAAAVRSMLANPGIAFFNSFDASGFVTVDKPPVGIWVQAASAALFGFSNWSVVLPQAIAGIGSVVLIYFIVNRPFGKPAGLIAAFALATTPVFVIASRFETMDTQMIFVLLLAVWVALKAARAHSFWYLMLSVVLVGIGFNIKMVQAFVVVPSIIAIYLLGVSLPARQKVVHIAVALLVLALVSLSWAIVVDSIPADQRPYIGSSGDNSVIGLITGHNGEEAFLDNSLNPSTSSMPPASLFRLFSQDLYFYFSWLLTFAFMGLLVWWEKLNPHSLISILKKGWPSEKGLTVGALGLWLFPALFYFSFTQGHWTYYYLATISAPLAGLVGIGAVTMYHEYFTECWKGWLLITAVIGTGLIEFWMIYRVFIYNPLEYGLLLFVLLVGCVIGAAILILLRIKRTQRTSPYSTFVVVIAVAALIVAPVMWSSASVIKVIDQNENTSTLSSFLLSHQGKSTYIAAVPSSSVLGSALIIDTGKPVMAIGGFFGTDQILTSEKLSSLIHNQSVRYFLIPSGNYTVVRYSNGVKNIGENAYLYTWVSNHCRDVPVYEWSSGKDNALTIFQVYDCAGAA